MTKRTVSLQFEARYTRMAWGSMPEPWAGGRKRWSNIRSKSLEQKKMERTKVSTPESAGALKNTLDFVYYVRGLLFFLKVTSEG